MTVGDLIEALSMFPDEMRLRVAGRDLLTFGDVIEVREFQDTPVDEVWVVLRVD